LLLPIIAYILSSTKLEIRENSFCQILRWWGREGGGVVDGKGGDGGGGRNDPSTYYAHMNNKTIKEKTHVVLQ
jgi:hypothetical protein